MPQCQKQRYVSANFEAVLILTSLFSFFIHKSNSSVSSTKVSLTSLLAAFFQKTYTRNKWTGEVKRKASRWPKENPDPAPSPSPTIEQNRSEMFLPLSLPPLAQPIDVISPQGYTTRPQSAVVHSSRELVPSSWGLPACRAGAVPRRLKCGVSRFHTQACHPFHFIPYSSQAPSTHAH